MSNPVGFKEAYDKLVKPYSTPIYKNVSFEQCPKCKLNIAIRSLDQQRALDEEATSVLYCENCRTQTVIKK